MIMYAGLRSRFGLVVTGALALLLVTPAIAMPANDSGDAKTVGDVEFLGEVVVPTGTMFDGTEIGGLSSITYDARARGLSHTVRRSGQPADR